MNREIKFRGKRKENGEWGYGFYVCIGTGENSHHIAEIEKDDFTEYYEVIPESVGQYTGLKDKNGKEIYEGDIIYGLRDGELNYSKVKAVVVFKDGTFMDTYFGYTLSSFTNVSYGYGNVIEVIGNIYENPELLNQ